MIFGSERSRAKIQLVLVAVAAASLAGCHRGPRMAHVRGKVFYKDGTVPRGAICVINFNPADDTTAERRQVASSAIAPDGSFDMITKLPGDGVYYGDYVVTFSVSKGPMDPTLLILPKYASKVDSPYKEKIDGNRTDLRYEIEPAPGVKGAPPSG